MTVSLWLGAIFFMFMLNVAALHMMTYFASEKQQRTYVPMMLITYELLLAGLGFTGGLVLVKFVVRYLT